MTERLALGITVGASNSVAVAAHRDSRGVGATITHPSVLRLTEGAPPTFGSTARPTGRHTADVVLEGFLTRVGDPVDMLADDGSAHSAADLHATAISCLIDEITSGTGESTPESIAACYPAWWSRHTVDAQRAALDRAGLPAVTLVPEPTAAVRWLHATHGPRDDGAVLVYDLGATGLTVSVVRTTAPAALLGTPLRSTEVAGAEFDLLTMRYVLANALRGNDFDPFDPAVERELATLRMRCRNAKEELSINTATVVSVRVHPAEPGPGEQVRLVRGELEDLLREPLLRSTELIRGAVHRAGLEIGDIGRVLLTGGGAAIPLVAELISSEFGLPVVAAPEPAHTSAHGAALLAAELRAAAAPTVPTPAVLAAPQTRAPDIPESARPSPAQPLPRTDRRRGLSGRQRAAIVLGAALALGVLATGTVAISTGVSSGPDNQPAVSTAPGVTEAAGGSTPSGGPAAPVSAVSDPVTGRPGTPTARTGSTPSSVIPASNIEQNPGQPTEAAAPQPDSPQPPPPNTQPASPPQQHIPGPQPPSVPTAVPPNLSTLPRDTIDQVGGAVQSAIGVPGKTPGGSGG